MKTKFVYRMLKEEINLVLLNAIHAAENQFKNSMLTH